MVGGRRMYAASASSVDGNAEGGGRLSGEDQRHGEGGGLLTDAEIEPQPTPQQLALEEVRNFNPDQRFQVDTDSASEYCTDDAEEPMRAAPSAIWLASRPAVGGRKREVFTTDDFLARLATWTTAQLNEIKAASRLEDLSSHLQDNLATVKDISSELRNWEHAKFGAEIVLKWQRGRKRHATWKAWAKLRRAMRDAASTGS
eukprot:1100290-Rhodomonas_salina.1